ncbi:type IV pilus modification PilV family protein [Lysobacter fragariae]
MAKTYRRTVGSRDAGFSLIEVMIAVVVLATGLLALAAMQGTLARNAADAKARGAIMAALHSRMAEIRQSPPSAGKTWTMADGWVSTAATQAGASDLSVVETITPERWNGTTFVTTAVANPKAAFTRASLAATWTSSTGARSLTIGSDVSGNIYGDGNGYPTPDPSGSAAKFPIVRQDNPSNTAGVIPIVTGNQATAASNPQPIIEGANNNLRVGTSFDVLNYVPEGSTAKITKRFQTEVIKCRCQYGQSDYSVAGEAQWPALWDGSSYTTYTTTSADPAGKLANAGEDPDFGGGTGKKTTRLQSEQCTECCRDHHDSSSSPLEARYDPEATAVGKFNLSGGTLTAVTNTVNGKYVAACRVVKADGIWKTSADMYARQYGLLETTTVSGKQAKSGIPTSTASSNYQTFVKDYLSLYTGSSDTAPAGAQAMFDQTSRNLNAPTTVAIDTPSTSDYRYLHGRGLYVDYLGSKAKSVVGKAITDCPSGTPLTECILPILPFTTINLTEMASWTEDSPSPTAGVLNINTAKTLNFDVNQPSGGRTAGIKAGTANNQSELRMSNSGVAVSDDIPGAVDTNGDSTTYKDAQSFQVASSSGGGSTGDSFNVVTSGGGSNPFLNYTIAADTGPCTYSSKWTCPTNSVLPAAGQVTISNYNQEATIGYVLNLAAQCTYVGNGNFNNPGNMTVQQPVFTNYAVTGVTGGGASSWSVTGNTGKTNEITTITLGTIPKAPAQISVTLAAESGQLLATLGSCTYDKSGNAAVLKTIVWNRSWQ